MHSTMADLAASRDSLSKTTVTAPIEGIVTALPIKEGEVTVIGTMNNAGTQLMTISDMGVGRGRDDGRRDLGAAGQGRPEGDPDDRRLSEHASSRARSPRSAPRRSRRTIPDLLALIANSEAINFKVKIRIDNPPDTIRPGFSVTADIVTGRRDGATAIPIQALVVRDVPKKDKTPAPGRARRPRKASTSIKDGKLVFDKVETGIAGELMIEVKNGPAVGQEIVTGPFKVLRQVKEGDKVIIEKEGGGKKGGPKNGVTTSELFRVSSAALTRHKLRAFLTLLGVIIGVATVVGVVSVISGLNVYVKDKVIGLNPDIVIFTKYGIITSREEWLMARKRRDLTLTDMEVVRRECTPLRQRRRARRPATGRSSTRTASCPQVEIQGHTPNMGEAMNFDIDNGRYFTEAEYNHSAPVAVIGWDVQDELFPNIDPIGRIDEDRRLSRSRSSARSPSRGACSGRARTTSSTSR